MTQFADMFVDQADDPRHDPPLDGDERTTLVAFLDWYRDTLELKCAGLDAEALAKRALPPSNLSLLGLVRHMADVERSWFRRTLAGEEAPPIHYTREEPDLDFDGATADPEVVAYAWSTWREERAFADRFIAGAPNLEVTGRMRDSSAVSLRWVLVHMIEEYARHAGHADLVRQFIDGRVGQ